MKMNGEFAMHDYLPLLPEAFLCLSALVLLIAGVFLGNRGTRTIGRAAVYCLFFTMFLLISVSWDRAVLFGCMFVMDGFAGLVKLFTTGGLAVAMTMSLTYIYQERINRFEYPVLVMLSGVGMMLMVSAHNLLALYVGVELQSLCLYILAAFHRDMTRSAEAGIKYFILGAISSGFLLFGASLIYGISGTLDFQNISDLIAGLEFSGTAIPVILTGLVFVLSGLAFKVSAVPFHMWTPDVYQGAPTSVTSLFAMVPKLAAMALLIRVVTGPFGGLHEQWTQVLWIMSAASMVIGTFAALKQSNIKRLMAYASIANMGYALMGVAVYTPEGIGAALLYMLIYMVAVAGTFAVILVMRRDNFALEDIGDLAGIARTRPLTAYAMVLMMFSMTGIPPLAGFFAKFAVFMAAVEAGYYVLAVIGVLSSVVAAFYYLRIVKIILFDEAADILDPARSPACRAVMFVSSAFAVFFVVYPLPLISVTYDAAVTLFSVT